MNWYFAKGNRNSDFESEEALVINNCGYYRSLDEPLRIERPRGRRDYQLILCVLGEIEVNGARLARGDAYLLAPHQPQHYSYLPAPDAYYCWIHFTGREAEEVLCRAGLERGVIRCRSHLSELEELVRLLIKLLGEGGTNAEEVAAHLLRSILLLLPSAKAKATPFSTAIKRLDDLEQAVTVGELAAHYRMSTAHFIRTFRACFGVSPYRYRRGRQIELSKLLLAETTLNVTQISSRVGIDDPLYFSRVFRSAVGRSPLEYRKESRKL